MFFRKYNCKMVKKFYKSSIIPIYKQNKNCIFLVLEKIEIILFNKFCSANNNLTLKK